MMKKQMLLGLVTILLICVEFAVPPLRAKDKGQNDAALDKKGVLAKMDAVQCGTSERGINGLGGLLASVGVQRMKSFERLCPEYQLLTEEVEYRIRPMDEKHPDVLPVGHDGLFRITKDKMQLQVVDFDGVTRDYQVVSMRTRDSERAADFQPAKKSQSDDKKSPAQDSDKKSQANNTKSQNPDQKTNGGSVAK